LLGLRLLRVGRLVFYRIFKISVAILAYSNDKRTFASDFKRAWQPAVLSFCERTILLLLSGLSPAGYSSNIFEPWGGKSIPVT
jgi:hypothetical protein